MKILEVLAYSFRAHMNFICVFALCLAGTTQNPQKRDLGETR